MRPPSNELLKETRGYFGEYQRVYLATLDGGQPRVRPVTLVHLRRRWWIFTGTNDGKVSQLKQSPWYELCLPLDRGDHHGYVRVSGSAAIVKDQATRSLLAGRCKFFKKYWERADDPAFTLLELQFEAFELLRPGEMMSVAFRLQGTGR